MYVHSRISAVRSSHESTRLATTCRHNGLQWQGKVQMPGRRESAVMQGLKSFHINDRRKE
ncbi:MAG: hypothetical protein HF976_05095 [ANME-2 cluster archaeon]|nr:hypothetical protein [ANME-2 cluster archaeon]MBC2700782.1 hypothetical protein [ANME-2 cluster archaeon]MBC2709003.1 hypothetical protein [ANME-2 cluster archaeon]MBC2747263.1 hypothetical protein [ANME-2 cluster archaeon]MBC2763456.1 hypothetical protein [ANME-2 cluster archaeon]